MKKLTDIYVTLPLTQFLLHRDEVTKAILNVCNSGAYILGEEVVEFEQEFAAYHHVKYCIGVGSGTDALILAMRALGITAGDEVITVAHTALATVAAIIAVGATPVLVDVEEEYYTLDPQKLPAALSERTKAIIPVHLYGQPCDLRPIMAFAKEHGLKVIEDCAQAVSAEYHGQKVGTFGDAGCFSFYPTKNLGALGDGGAVICNNAELDCRLRQLRQYGWDENRLATCVSTVSRLDEIQAAILRVKLKYLDSDNQKRKTLAEQYDRALSHSAIAKPKLRDASSHALHLYVVKVGNRDHAITMLARQNVYAGIHYRLAVHQQPGYRPYLSIPEPLSVTEMLVERILTLPLYPELTIEQVQHVSDQLNRIVSREHAFVV